MTYDEAIRFWYSRINYEVRAARPQDFKLERMREFLHRLGDPQIGMRTVHITGTKGKGSTAAMIAAIARTAGLKVGLFTSPHLVKVEERIQVSGEPIPASDLAAGMTALRPVVEAMDAGPWAPLTFFEIVTALGWLHFRDRQVDLAVMEVGLGGRFDSTNVCTPDVTVITNVGYDHMAQLGNTLEKIAYQKAGIIKPGVPCVMGSLADGARQVVHRVAREVKAPIHEAGLDFPLRYEDRLQLLGEHQMQNASLARQTASILQLPDAAVKNGLTRVVWPARIEVLSRDPAVILDCAHNVPSVQALVATLARDFPQARSRLGIFAVSADKQYREMLAILAGFFDRLILTRYDNPRCVPPEMLAALIPEPTIIEPALAAWEQARQSDFDLICVTGSVFLAGELRDAMLSSSSGGKFPCR